MTNLSFSIQSQIKATVESDQEFAVHFDTAWQWLEYSSKGNAKRTLTANFEEGVDYSSLITIDKREIGATRVEEIYLTKDCLKQLSMLSGTAKGKAVRLYFIECERELKAIKAAKLQQPTDILYLLEESAKAIKEARALAAQAESKVVELTPKADNWTRLCDTNGGMTISAVAKNLAISGMGPNNLFKFLRDKGFVFINSQGCNVPKSTIVEKGYMKTVEKYDYTRNKSYSVCVCTYKGYSFIVRQLKKAGFTTPPDTTTPNAAALVA
jgi:anti-repressor protein